MRRSFRPFVLLFSGALVLAFALALLPTHAAQAQCGSQASSCKNCHEVQGQDPVNTNGEWHIGHAFGDFCAFCHGGNVQATDKTAAHAGMVAPLSDIQANCASCHPTDTQDRAKVYAAVLGVSIGTGPSSGPAAPPSAGSDGGSSSSPSSSSAGNPSAPASTAGPAPAPGASSEAGLVDYVQRYDENALGEYPTNWGNVILIALIAIVLVGGGSYVIYAEGLVKISFVETRPLGDEYPKDIVDMIPRIARLKPSARTSLRHLLEHPQATEDLLVSVDKLTSRAQAKD
jgi:cytochrome c553